MNKIKTKKNKRLFLIIFLTVLIISSVLLYSYSAQNLITDSSSISLFKENTTQLQDSDSLGTTVKQYCDEYGFDYEKAAEKIPHTWEHSQAIAVTNSNIYSIFTRSGKYYLAEDIYTTGSINLPANTDISLCLNGHRLIVKNSSHKLNINSNFTIYDCNSSNREHRFYKKASSYALLYFIEGMSIWKEQDYESASEENKGTIKGGVIAGYGVGFSVNSDQKNIVFNFYGGTISRVQNLINIETSNNESDNCIINLNIQGGRILGINNIVGVVYSDYGDNEIKNFLNINGGLFINLSGISNYFSILNISNAVLINSELQGENINIKNSIISGMENNSYCNLSKSNIENCIIAGNNFSDTVSSYTKGLFVISDSRIENNIIKNNSANNMTNCFVLSQNNVFINNTILNNILESGDMFNCSDKNSISGNIIENNSSVSGNLFNFSGKNMIFENTVKNNSLGNGNLFKCSGEDMFIDNIIENNNISTGKVFNSDGVINVNKCNIIGNSISNGEIIGAVNKCILSNCNIENNTVGEGNSLINSVEIRLQNCYFDKSGASLNIIGISGETIILSNCTLTDKRSIASEPMLSAVKLIDIYDTEIYSLYANNNNIFAADGGLIKITGGYIKGGIDSDGTITADITGGYFSLGNEENNSIMGYVISGYNVYDISKNDYLDLGYKEGYSYAIYKNTTKKITLTNVRASKVYDNEPISKGTDFNCTLPTGCSSDRILYMNTLTSANEFKSGLPTNAGEYTIAAYYRMYSGEEYINSSSITFRIDKAEVGEIPQGPNTLTATYGTKFSEVELPENWKWKNADDYVGNVGLRKEVIIYDADYLNYDWSGIEGYNGQYYEAELDLLIEKAVPVTEIPTAIKVKNGKKLSEIELPEGWSFIDNPSTVVDKENNKFTIVYTPSDTENYETLTAEITLNITGMKPITLIIIICSVLGGITLLTVISIIVFFVLRKKDYN